MQSTSPPPSATTGALSYAHIQRWQPLLSWIVGCIIPSYSPQCRLLLRKVKRWLSTDGTSALKDFHLCNTGFPTLHLHRVYPLLLEALNMNCPA